MRQPGHQEAVILFNADEEIAEEMSMQTFAAHLAGAPMGTYAASVVKAGYCVVANGLRLAGVTFFLFDVDETGRVSNKFNLPLRYLLEQARVFDGPGQGRLRKASRGWCPVPWHATHLWEPQSENVLACIQQRLYLNKLNLKVVYQGVDIFKDIDGGPEAAEFIELDEHDSLPADHPLPTCVPALLQGDGSKDVDDVAAFTEKLEQLLGREGKFSVQRMIHMHAQQLNEADSQHRRMLESQQSSYQDQLRTYQQEIHDLKMAVRQEQSRNRRLQEVLQKDS